MLTFNDFADEKRLDIQQGSEFEKRLGFSNVDFKANLTDIVLISDRFGSRVSEHFVPGWSGKKDMARCYGEVAKLLADSSTRESRGVVKDGNLRFTNRLRRTGVESDTKTMGLLVGIGQDYRDVMKDQSAYDDGIILPDGSFAKKCMFYNEGPDTLTSGVYLFAFKDLYDSKSHVGDWVDKGYLSSYAHEYGEYVDNMDGYLSSIRDETIISHGDVLDYDMNGTPQVVGLSDLSKYQILREYETDWLEYRKDKERVSEFESKSESKSKDNVIKPDSACITEFLNSFGNDDAESDNDMDFLPY